MEIFDNPFKLITGIVGAALLSIFGAFVKDWILRLLSFFSSQIKSKQKKQQEIIAKQVSFLMQNQAILILYCTKVAITQICGYCLMIVALTLPTWFTVFVTSGETIVFSKEIMPALNYIITATFAVVALIINYKSSKRFFLITRALLPYTSKKGGAEKILP
ncbi:hypothetical protein ACN5OH_003579 [Cronobacter turicensis]|uniref:hypothetical protein n=1 Tax=Cronobacter turicensis TaxID=413502 RepID=UPI0024AF5B37|nr:hypothetical protein [Cronobacter turicensis]ELY2781694.1 hypothetical protein [Cronobacter turicensis]ELY4574410.1 hypothetical protein [Cronobacter turicensis]MDI7405507.1 hypothetical protein [Cronobacter turicensis]